MAEFQKRILAAILKDDYGKPERGPGGEYIYFYSALETLCQTVQLFDVGPFLKQPDLLREKLLKAIDEFKPDLVFFSIFLDECTPELLDTIRARTKTANWFPDDQWRFNIYSKHYGKHFSTVITTDPYVLKKYTNTGCSDVLLSQFAIKVPIQAPTTPITYKYDVSFIGVATTYRTWLISELRKRGIEVSTFGTGWPNGRVPYEKMPETFCQTKINLNISNSKNYDIRYVLSSIHNFQDFRRTKKNKEQIKGRHFEICGGYGFQLTNYVEFLEDYFTIGKEIAVYNTIDDMTEKIKFYLENEDLRETIVRQGYERVAKDHTYVQRFKDILNHIFHST
ncbi:MAG: glycosyltransferase [Patescibacteria group bacterium]